MGLCVAFRCTEVGNYKFPRDPVMRKKWEKTLKLVNFKATDFSRLCGKHFKESDFETTSKQTGFPLRRKFLKKSAVPSIFSWNSTPDAGVSARTLRLQERNARRCLIPSIPDPCCPTSSSIENNIICDFVNEIEILNENEEIDDFVEPHNSNNQSISQSTQTLTCFRIFSSNELLVDDQSVQFYTGLEGYDKFKLVLSTLCPMANNLKYKGCQITGVSIEDQFLIMLMKIRRNMCDYELSKYFGISKTAVSNIFVTWVNFSYDLWSLIDIWPERELIDYYMPVSFKRFLNTRIIIDGTEIPITRPKNPTSQQATFSSYKNRNTMKFLVGATPSGLFSYCSEGYGGSTSDRQMIERSNLLEKCEPGDSIMADRGFNVQDIFSNKDVSVNIPAFLKGKSQLSGVTVKHDRELASRRVHIERLIGLTKTFKILKSELNAYYVPLASRIFFVCIMLCNFREGIVNKQK